jgi:hypothetical protein
MKKSRRETYKFPGPSAYELAMESTGHTKRDIQVGQWIDKIATYKRKK